MGVWHISNFLIGDAATWWRLHSLKVNQGRAAPVRTWAELKMLMEAQFVEINRRTTLRDELTNLKQKGSIQGYCNRFRALVVELGDESEENQLYFFYKGLSAAVASHTQAACPDTLEKAMLIAANVDNVHHRAFSQEAKRAGFIPGPSTQPDAPAPMQLGALALSPTEKEQCIREGRCFRCKEKGHASRHCPQRKARSSND